MVYEEMGFFIVVGGGSHPVCVCGGSHPGRWWMCVGWW